MMSGCADFSRGESPAIADAAALPDTGLPADDAGGTQIADAATTATVTFSQVHPLLLSACRDCHRSGGQAANTTLLFSGNESTDLATTLPYINRNDAGNSRLITKSTGRNHGGGATWAPGSSTVATVLSWIQQGAQP